MFFNSLLFNYQIFRKPGDLNEVIISVPRNWWWSPTNASYVLIHSDGSIIDVGFVDIHLKTKKLVFEDIKDGYTLKVILRYAGFFWNRQQNIEITAPYRLKPARNLQTKILRVY